LAVASVILTHLGLSWAPGAFFGVSTFFTLSGFLITSLLIAESAERGRISLGSFWVRRARRLLPAAYFTIALMLVLNRLGWGPPDPHASREAIAALFYAANWYYLLHPPVISFFLHLWSLAVEEQFYFFFPLLFVGVRRSLTRWAGLAFGVAALVLTVTNVLQRLGEPNSDAAQFATHRRAPELLAGVCLAYALAHPRGRAFLAAPRWFRWRQVGGALGLAGFVYLVTHVGAGDRRLILGGVQLNTLCSILMVVACLGPGFFTRFLSLRPLTRLGRISYGTYLLHSPVLLVLAFHPFGMNLFWRSVATFVLSIAAAELSFRFVEQPFRYRRAASNRQVAAMALSGATMVLALALVLRQAPDRVVELSVPASDPFAQVDRKADVKSRRIVVVGDEAAELLVPRLVRYFETEPGRYWGRAITRPGCGTGGVPVLQLDGSPSAVGRACRDWRYFLGGTVAKAEPDVLLVATGFADVGTPQQLPDGRVAEVGDPAVDAQVLARLRSMVDGLGPAGATRIVWFLAPLSAGPPAQVQRFNALVHQVLDSRREVTIRPLPTGSERLDWQAILGPP
jgi:peptidoglycan/LPS O-acetylase OafA/YrhL